MRNPRRIQAAGNSGLCGDITIDSKEDIKSNRPRKRTEGILFYIHDENGVTKEMYMEDVPEYLKRNYGVEENNSNKMHWLNKPWWWGFVDESAVNYFRITPVGQQWLDIVTSNKEDKRESLMRLMLDQGTRIKYPNPATPKVDPTVSVRPFILLFYLFLKYEYLTYDELTCVLPYVTDASYLDENDELDFKNLGTLGERYTKLFAWDIVDFIKLGAISVTKTDDGDHYSLNPEYVDYVKYYYGKYTALDIFLNGAKAVKGYLANKSIVRDSKVPTKVKQRDLYKEVLTGASADWHTAADGNLGCQAHHIIPLEQKNHYMKKYGVNIDSEDYCITFLCETHRKLHEAKFEEKKELIVKMFNWLSDDAKSKIDLTLDKFFEIYK